MEIIDAHNHYWHYEPQEYSWIGEEHGPLKKDCLPADLDPELEKHNVTGTIAVQARQNLEENRFLLQVADRNPIVKGVVGWLDLRAGNVEENLQSYASAAKSVGLRHFIQSEPEEGFMLRDDFRRGIAALKHWGLTYDILIGHRQLAETVKFVELFPDQPFVLDHIAKPPIKAGIIEPWKTEMQQLARHPQLHCKISGLVTEADWQHWQEEELKPYLDVVFEAFGPDRLMFGSDWPVCLLAAPYSKVVKLVKGYIAQLPEQDQEKIMSHNAKAFYKLK